MKKWIITLLLLLGWSAAQAQSDTTGLVRVDSDEVEVWVPDMANTGSKQEAKAKKRGQKCIGCPYAKECTSQVCGCGCGEK